VLLVLLGVLVFSSALHERIARAVLANVERSQGLSIDFDALDLDVLAGRAVVLGARVRARGAESELVRVARVEARVRRLPLLRGRLEIANLEIDGPLVDLAATLPDASAAPEGESTLDVAIERLRIEGGELRGAPAPDTSALRSWALRDLAAEGSLRGGDLDLEAHGRLTSELELSSDRPPARIEADARASLRLVDLSRVESARLDLEGEGLDLGVEGRASWGPGGEVAASLSGKVEPGVWVGELDGAGALEVEGDVRGPLEALRARLAVRGDRVPAALADPALDLAGLQGVATRDSQVDARLDLELLLDGVAVRLQGWQGEGELRWRNAAETLLEAHARFETAAEGGAWRVPVSATVRPDAEAAEIEADLRLVDGEPQELLLDSSRATLRTRDLRAWLRPLWTPDEAIDVWLPEGAVALDLAASGSWRRPRLAGSVTMESDGERLVDLTLGEAQGGDGQAFELALLPRSRARLAARGAWLWHPSEPLRPVAVAPAELELGAPSVAFLSTELDRVWGRVLPRAPGWAELVPDGVPELLRELDGEVEVRATLDGELAHPAIETSADLRLPEQGALSARLSGGLRWESPFLDATSRARVTLEGGRLELLDRAAPLGGWSAPGLAGRVDAELELARPGAAMTGRLTITGEDWRSAEVPWLEALRLEASYEAGRLEVSTLEGRLPPGEPPSGSARFDGQATFERLLESPTGRLDLRLLLPDAPIGESRLALLLEAGALRVESGAEGEPGRLEARLPLAPLFGPGGLRELPAWPGPLAEGEWSLHAADVDLAPWAALLPPDFGSLVGNVDLAIELDPRRPWEAHGDLRTRGLRWSAQDVSLAVRDETELRLGGGRIELAPAEIALEGPRAREAPTLEAEGWIELDREAFGGEDWTRIVRDSSLRLQGAAESAFLNPFLAGAIARGEVRVDLRVEGPLAAWRLEGELDGTGAEVFFGHGVGLKLESPRGRLVRDGDGFRLEGGEGILNKGRVELTGTSDGKGRLELRSELRGVRYRLPSGLTFLLDASLGLDWSPPRPGRLSGTVRIDRGALRRDMYLDREILALLAEEVAAGTGSELGDLGRIVLDIDVTTRQGVSLANNIAEMHLDWSVLHVRGTLDEMEITGRIDADPGGWLDVFGQLLRVDAMSIDLGAEADGAPRIEVSTTSSLDDPTLYEQRRRGIWYSGLGNQGPRTDLFWQERQHGSDAELAWITSGLTTYYGNRIARKLGATLGALRFSFQPLPLFGESDTRARLTLTQRLTPSMTFIASSDTRQAEAQTYILQIEDLLPSTSAQLFTTDDKTEGLALQWTSGLGGGPRIDASQPTLRRIRFEVPEALDRKKLRKSIGFARGDSVAPAADLDVELDVVEEVRRQGYPGSQVTAAFEEVGDRQVDLEVTVATGPRVEMVYEGIELPRFARELVETRYLPEEIDAGASLEDVREEAERALRRMGHFRPQVAIDVRPVAGRDFAEEREVHVALASAGILSLAEIRFEGVSPAEAEYLEREHASLRRRIELAERLPEAERLVERLLRNLGYREGALREVAVEAEGELLRVVVEPGPRLEISKIRVEGLEPEPTARLEERLHAALGDTRVTNSLYAAVREAESALHDQGYARARIDSRVRAVEGDPNRIELDLLVDRGPRVELREVRIEGLRHTKESWLRQVAGLDVRVGLDSTGIADARRRLFETRLFEGIVVDRKAVREDDELVQVDVVYRVEEGPRYLVSYGGRWETDRGFSAVFDAVDRNLFGRGQTLGLGGLYGSDLQRLNLYYSYPRFPRPSSTLELFGEWHREDLADLRSDDLSARIQTTFPLGSATLVRPFVRVVERNVRALGGERLSDSEESDLERVPSPMVGVQLAYDTRETSLGSGILDQGTYLGLQVSYSAGHLTRQPGGYEAFGEWRYFHALKRYESGPVVWAQRWHAGVQGIDDGFVSLFDRFRLGGEYSVRGYPTESLGPRDENGTPLGGEAVFLVNQELHFPVWRGITGLLFFDAGNVWEDARAYDGKLFTAAGVGLRASALRLDFGVPLDRREGDPSYQIYFGLGSAF